MSHSHILGLIRKLVVTGIPPVVHSSQMERFRFCQLFWKVFLIHWRPMPYVCIVLALWSVHFVFSLSLKHWKWACSYSPIAITSIFCVYFILWAGILHLFVSGHPCGDIGSTSSNFTWLECNCESLQNADSFQIQELHTPFSFFVQQFIERSPLKWFAFCGVHCARMYHVVLRFWMWWHLHFLSIMGWFLTFILPEISVYLSKYLWMYPRPWTYGCYLDKSCQWGSKD